MDSNNFEDCQNWYMGAECMYPECDCDVEYEIDDDFPDIEELPEMFEAVSMEDGWMDDY